NLDGHADHHRSRGFRPVRRPVPGGLTLRTSTIRGPGGGRCRLVWGPPYPTRGGSTSLSSSTERHPCDVRYPLIDRHGVCPASGLLYAKAVRNRFVHEGTSGCPLTPPPPRL